MGYGTYFLFATLMVLMGFWAFFFIPETKGLTLEDMDALFSGSMSKAVWKSVVTRRPVRDVLNDKRMSEDIQVVRSPAEIDEKHVGMHIEAVGVSSKDEPHFPKQARVLSC